MKTITHMVASEPEVVCEVHTGTFVYLDTHGEETAAEFYVKTCEDDQARRVDDYNSQYCDMYTQLQLDGATRIRYNEVVPNSIF